MNSRFKHLLISQFQQNTNSANWVPGFLIGTKMGTCSKQVLTICLGYTGIMSHLIWY